MSYRQPQAELSLVYSKRHAAERFHLLHYLRYSPVQEFTHQFRNCLLDCSYPHSRWEPGGFTCLTQPPRLPAACGWLRQLLPQPTWSIKPGCGINFWCPRGRRGETLQVDSSADREMCPTALGSSPAAGAAAWGQDMGHRAGQVTAGQIHTTFGHPSRHRDVPSSPSCESALLMSKLCTPMETRSTPAWGKGNLSSTKGQAVKLR